MPKAPANEKERRRAQLRKARQRYYQRHQERLKLVRKVDSILLRKTRRPDDMERLSKLLREFLDDTNRKKLKRML
jgi:hypothetical protein